MASFVEFPTLDGVQATINVELIAWFHQSARDAAATEIAFAPNGEGERLTVRASYAEVRDALHERPSGVSAAA
jgi:hypothetical protein